MKPLVFWQNVPSIHQAPLVRAMADEWNGPVHVVTDEDLPSHRAELGWERPDYGNATLVVAPRRSARRRLMADVERYPAVHIFSGLRAYRETVWTMRQVARTGNVMGVFLEPLREDDVPRALLRYAVYRRLALKWRARVEFILVTGERGMRRYAELGFHLDRLFPFAYVVGAHRVRPGLGRGGGPVAKGQVRLLLVGRMIRQKGVGLLFGALAQVAFEGWVLDVIGRGPEMTRLKAHSEELGLSRHIRWLGPRPNDEVRARMAVADVVVLPSIYDGWGAVVNEALTAGARVLVSAGAGAADLAARAPGGRVFETGSMWSCTRELDALLAAGPITYHERREVQRWAEDVISPGVVARYLRRIISFVEHGGERPSPPWASRPRASGH